MYDWTAFKHRRILFLVANEFEIITAWQIIDENSTHIQHRRQMSKQSMVMPFFAYFHLCVQLNKYCLQLARLHNRSLILAYLSPHLLCRTCEWSMAWIVQSKPVEQAVLFGMFMVHQIHQWSVYIKHGVLSTLHQGVFNWTQRCLKPWDLGPTSYHFIIISIPSALSQGTRLSGLHKPLFKQQQQETNIATDVVLSSTNLRGNGRCDAPDYTCKDDAA